MDISNSHFVHYNLSISEINCVWRVGGGGNKMHQLVLGSIGERKKKAVNSLVIKVTMNEGIVNAINWTFFATPSTFSFECLSYPLQIFLVLLP